MPFPFVRSLRARLVLVVLVALIPLVGLFAYSHRELHRLAEAEWRDASAQTADQVVQDYQRAVEETRSMVSILAQVGDMRRGGEACTTLVARLLEDLPLQTALGRVDPDGMARCMAPAQEEPLDLRDRDYIRRALETGEPQFSGFQLGRLTGRPVMSLAHPIVEPDGTVIGAVATGVELHRLRIPPIPAARTEAVTVTVYDPQGRILARTPEDPGVLGETVPWDPISSTSQTAPAGFVRDRDLDGQERIFAVRALFTGDGVPKGFVAVGFDPDAARVGLDRTFRDHLLGLFLAGAALVLGIWLVLEFTFLRRLSPVVSTARRIGEGDLSARTGLQQGSDEVSVLARTVDRMAANLQMLQRRDEEEARQEIRERESRLQQLAESVDEVFWLLDPDRKQVLYVNSNYERVFGMSVASLREDPASWLEAVRPDDRDEVARRLAEDAHTRCEMEFRVVRPDGEIRWVRYHGFPTRDPEGRVHRVAAVARDITERRRMEEILHQSGKLEAVGRLAGGVAHDFNNVLTIIRGHTHFLLDTLDEESHVRRDVAAIDAAASRSASLTRQLLAFSRKQPLHPRRVKVNGVIRELRPMLVRLVGEEVELRFELTEDLPPVRVDPNQLEQALINLAANARDAMKGSGTLTVRTGTLQVEPGGQPDDAVPPPGSYVRLTVSDTGAGMDEEVRRHAFEPFFTTKGIGEGTGLGLASVYGIVKQSGGFIQVASEPGRGARFDIDLPRVDDAPETEPSGSPGVARDQASSDGQETILVVEDEEPVLRVVRTALERKGYRILAARSGIEGREVFLDHRDEVDLLLTDVVMPGLGGPELVDELRVMDPHLPVLFMSGYPAMARRGMEAAGSRSQFLQKPFSPAELTAKVREILDRDRESGNGDAPREAELAGDP